MCRIPCLLLGIGLVPTNSSCQFQRLALVFGECVALAGSSVENPAFCIDPHHAALRD